MRTFRPGDIVLYSPIIDGPSFGCVVVHEPWKLGSGHDVTTVCHLGKEYQEHVGCAGRTRSCGVLLRALRMAPTEYVEGEWCLAGQDEPSAVISFATLPHPDTGHIGWIWWALGKLGDADSYEDAKRKAEAVIAQLIADANP